MSQPNTIYQYFATTPKGLELLLVEELRALGAINPAEKLAGVTFSGDLAVAYKACLWSRLANRILLRLSQVPAATPEELYAGIQTIAWENHLDPSKTLHVNFVTTQSNITHTLFGAQKVKDAIVDQFRTQCNARPNVAKENPDVSVHVYLHRNIATISLDLSGESLHKRGYRIQQGIAPLKENLAAAILLRAGWPSIAKAGGILLDPMCGSGTLLIEGALMAGQVAPGLLHDYFGFLGWNQHDPHLWNTLRLEAEEQRQQSIKLIPPIIGYDVNSLAIKMAFANIERAGLHGKIHVEKRDVSSCSVKHTQGLLVTNPPYGERLGEQPELSTLYNNLGTLLKNQFVHWNAAIFTGNPELGKTMGIRAKKHYAFFNGAIPCQLLLFDVEPEYFIDKSPEADNERRIRRAQKSLTDHDRELAKMLLNRLQKNIKNLKSWRERDNISAYRVYDADLPEYAISIDIFNENICVQEYPAPKSIDKNKAEQRLKQALAILPDAFSVPSSKIYFREKKFLGMENLNSFYPIKENRATFLINLLDASLEVGLPLEQRNLRTHIHDIVKGKRFLNVFSRSGAMSVMAALGEALTVTTVCESDVFYHWSQCHMDSNTCEGQLIQADVVQWLQKEKNQYDLIFVELPHIPFHMREEQMEVIPAISKLLAPQGELYLVTHDSRFKPHLENTQLEDISHLFLPKDFARHPKIQSVWKIISK